jgi:hypothetical protein
MSVSEPKITKKVLDAANYFKRLSDENYRRPIGSFEIRDRKLPEMIIYANYAASAFCGVDCLIDEKKTSEYIPSRKDIAKVGDMCKKICDGDSMFSQEEIYLAGKVCSALLKRLNAAPNAKKTCTVPAF